MESLVLTIREAAQALKIIRSTMYELLRRGEIRSVHMGRSLRIPKAEVHDYLGIAPNSMAESKPNKPDTQTGGGDQQIAWISEGHLVIDLRPLWKM